MAYAKKGEFGKAREDIRQAEQLGFKPDPEFIKELREMSGKKE
jgi:hypothetical protein